MKLRAFCLVVLMAAGAAGAENLPLVAVWQQVELPLTSAQEYKNPFKDVELSATFTSASGKKLAVDGFYFGGNRWRVRVMPTEEGVWSYATKSSDTAMDNLRGQFRAAKTHDTGPVFVDPKRPAGWAYPDGKPFYYNGAKCLPLFALPDHTPHLPFGGWQAFVDHCSEHGFNSVLVSLYFTRRSITLPGQTEESLPEYGTVWAARGAPDKPGDLTKATRVDFERFHLPQWDKMDEMIRQMKKRGIIAYVLLHPGGAPRIHNNRGFHLPGAMTAKQEQLYLRYAVARLASHANIRWCLAWDYAKYRDTNWAKKTGKLVSDLDPYGHPLTINGDTSFRLAGEDWVSFVCCTGDPGSENLLRKATKFNKPVVFDDYGNETDRRDSAEVIRRANWDLLFAGAWGSYGHVRRMGADMRKMKDTAPGAKAIGVMMGILKELPWAELRPAQRLVRKGARCLAAPGKAYLVYLPEGGETVLDIADEAKPMAVYRVDPATGTRKQLTRTVPGRRMPLAAPSFQKPTVFTIVSIEEAEEEKAPE